MDKFKIDSQQLEINFGIEKDQKDFLNDLDKKYPCAQLFVKILPGGNFSVGGVEMNREDLEEKFKFVHSLYEGERPGDGYFNGFSGNKPIVEPQKRPPYRKNPLFNPNK